MLLCSVSGVLLVARMPQPAAPIAPILHRLDGTRPASFFWADVGTSLASSLSQAFLTTLGLVLLLQLSALVLAVRVPLLPALAAYAYTVGLGAIVTPLSLAALLNRDATIMGLFAVAAGLVMLQWLTIRGLILATKTPPGRVRAGVVATLPIVLAGIGLLAYISSVASHR